MENQDSAIADGNVTIKFVTGRVAVIRELNGLEQTQVDEMVDFEKLTGLPNYRAVASLVSLDGTTFTEAKTPLALRSRLQKLKGRELEQLKRAISKEFGLPDDETLKKQSSDAEE